MIWKERLCNYSPYNFLGNTSILYMFIYFKYSPKK